METVLLILIILMILISILLAMRQTQTTISMNFAILDVLAAEDKNVHSGAITCEYEVPCYLLYRKPLPA